MKTVQNKIAIVNQPASQDSIVGTATRLQAGGSRIVILFAADAGDSGRLHGARTYLGHHIEG